MEVLEVWTCKNCAEGLHLGDQPVDQEVDHGEEPPAAPVPPPPPPLLPTMTWGNAGSSTEAPRSVDGVSEAGGEAGAASRGTGRAGRAASRGPAPSEGVQSQRSGATTHATAKMRKKRHGRAWETSYMEQIIDSLGSLYDQTIPLHRLIEMSGVGAPAKTLRRDCRLGPPGYLQEAGLEVWKAAARCRDGGEVTRHGVVIYRQYVRAQDEKVAKFQAIAFTEGRFNKSMVGKPVVKFDNGYWPNWILASVRQCQVNAFELNEAEYNSLVDFFKCAASGCLPSP